MEYEFGLSRIYELVINSNPCYAFLLDGNTLLQNKTVCAHVLAHCDFFKNNATFRHTSRDMVERMAASAERIRGYEIQYGLSEVEALLDAGLALQEHVDASEDGRNARAKVKEQSYRDKHGYQFKGKVFTSADKATTPYDDLWSIGVAEQADREKKPLVKPRAAQKDIMLFLIENSTILSEWQRDILSVLREEMLYFWPQMETKIMNEGWATYWHLRIMREMDLGGEDAIEFAKMHSGVVVPSKATINPYHLGLAIWEDIEKRWDNPTPEEMEKFGREPGRGREKMFEVREMENDVSFLRNYLTKELVEKLDLFLYQKIGDDWRVVETVWTKVRDGICASRVNGGIPVLYVQDGDYNHVGELFIRHEYEGMELDVKHLEKTLPYLQRLWGRTCHLQSVVDGRDVLFTNDGKRTQRKFI